MKKAFLLVLFIPVVLIAQVKMNFDDYFLDETLRIDYYHTGSAKDEFISIDQLYRYGNWAGSLTHLVDELNNGKYYAKIYDAKSKKLIYSKGFDTFFGEYKSSDKGVNGVLRSYHETVLTPYPKSKIIFALEQRDKKNSLIEFYRTEIDPNDIMIIKDQIIDEKVEFLRIVNNGNPHTKVDVAILAEGYTALEKSKFENDLQKFTDYFFIVEPYKSQKENFNIYGVFKPSEESGTDEPGSDIFKNTVLNTTFWSLGSERYLMTEDNKAMRNLAAHVPYDAIYIQVNHAKYGGGGIYNQFCTYTTDNQFDKYLFVHEFGHSFAGLGDEYYTSDVAYNDFYPKGVEPVEPNITALNSAPYVKWQHLVPSLTEIPTPWEKAEFDAMDLKWQAERRDLNQRVSMMKRERFPEDQIKAAEVEYADKDRRHSSLVSEFLMNSKYWEVVGVFEGAGYASKGLYRPMLDCIMFSKGDKPFCKVCEEAIKKVIKTYSE